MASALTTAFGLGAYQANLACTCVILIVVFIKMIIEHEDSKKIVKYILKSLFALATGCIIYKLIWLFHLTVLNISPSSYNGADSISIKAMLIHFPENIVKTYKCFISYFFQNSIKHNIFQKMGLYYIVFAIIIIILILKIVILAKENFAKAILIVVAFAILPMACNVSLFLATGAGGVMIQMTAGMTIFFPLMLCLVNSIKYTEKEIHMKKYKLTLAIYTLLSIIVLYGNVYMIAVDQETMYEGKNASETVVHEIISELRERQMLVSDKTYFFIGSPCKNPMFKTTKFWDMANSYARYGEFWEAINCMRMSYEGMFGEIGINLQYVADDVAAEIIEREDVKSMSVFPTEESIREIDGCIVVKVS